MSRRLPPAGWVQESVLPGRRWLPLHPMPTARHGLGAAVADGRLFAVAGGAASPGSTTGVNEELVPLMPLAVPSGRAEPASN